MITFRTIKTKEDLLKAQKLCEENKIEFPSQIEVLFGAFNGDTIVGLSCLQKVYQLEPIINISGHGHVTSVLLEKVLACASLLTNTIMGIVSRKEHLELYKKVGFYVDEEEVCHIRKSI